MKQPRQSDLRKTRPRSLHPHARAGASPAANPAADPATNPAAVPGIHPDTETLSAFAEHELAQPEHDQTLAHLATCSRCRQIVFLAQQAATEESTAQSRAAMPAPVAIPIPQDTPLATPFDIPEDAPRKNRLATLFPNLSFPVLAAAACCILAAGTLLLFPYLHHKKPITTPLVATQTEQQSAKLAQPELAQPSLAQPEPQSAAKVRSRTNSRSESGHASMPKSKLESRPVSRPARESHPHSSRPGRPHSPSSESKSLSPESFQAALKPQSPRPPRINHPRQGSAQASPRFPGTSMGFAARAMAPRSAAVLSSAGSAAPAPLSQKTAAQAESRSTPEPSSQPVDVTALTQALMDSPPLPAAAVIHAEEAVQQHAAKPSSSTPARPPASSKALAVAASRSGAVASRTPTEIQAVAQRVQSELTQLAQAQAPQIAPIPSLADGAVTTQQITELPKKQRATPTPANAAQASANNAAANQAANQAADQAADNNLAADAQSRPLPNGQNPIAAAAIGSTLLAIDSTGYLERSGDAGRSWEPIAPQWPGRLVSVRISPALSTTSNPQPPQFEVVTDEHLAYRSSDGLTWTSLPNTTQKQK